VVAQRRPGSRVAASVGIVALLMLVASCGAIGFAARVLPGCTGCHFDRPAFKTATLSAAHGSVSCADCHVDTTSVLSRGKFGLYEVFGMWLPILNPSGTDVALVADDRCLSCHGVVLRETVEARGFRIKHSSCGVGRTCVDCHSETGHGQATMWPTVASMGDCVVCHRASKISLKCETCHTGKDATRSFSKPEFSVTHGLNWKQTHGMGRMSTCSVCHQQDKCVRCHGPGVPHSATFLEDHPGYSSRSDAKCTSCHRPTFCADCHQIEMPHPEDFTRGHSLLVAREGQEVCWRCHAKSDCDDCHVMHVHPGGSVGRIPSPQTGRK
jgi:hypothetical protein